MSPLSVLLLVAAAGLAIFSLLHLRAAYIVFRGAARRRPRNVSHERRQPQASLAPLLGALTLLGFRRFGEVELVTPDMSLLGPLTGRQAGHTVWLLLDEPETTLAEVVEMGPMLSLETWLADDTIIHTTYPVGEDIDVPGWRATTVGGSPAEAYEHHRRMIDGRSAVAPPVGVHSMGEYLRHDASYRERFATLFLRRGFLQGPALSSLFMLVLAGGLAAAALLGWTQ